MAHDTYPRWTAHPSRALHDTRWRRARDRAPRSARPASWIAPAVGFVYGLVAAAVILAAIAVVGLVAHQPQALTTWLAVAAVVVSAGLATAAPTRRVRRRGG